MGDLSVGKYVKRIAQSFMARVNALEPLLSSGDVPACRPILRRNLYEEGPVPADAVLDRLSAYLMAQDRHLRDVGDADLLAGHLPFAAVDRLAPQAPRDRPGATPVAAAPIAGH